MAEKKVRRSRWLFLGLVLGVAICVGGWYAYKTYWEPLHSAPIAIEQETVIDLTVLQESVRQNNELSTAKYLYTDSESIEDQNNLSILGHKEIKLPFTKSTYVLEFDGVIKAGYDLNNAQVTLEDDTVVVVTLPPVQVLSHETSDVRVIHESQSVMNPLHLGEESTWIESQKAEMEQRAIDLGLYTEAQTNAKATFESLFAPVIPEGVTLKIVFTDDQGQVLDEQ